MKNAVKVLLTAIVVLWTGLVAAQLEVIELKSRSADEVLPVLLPLVEPGGTLTGVNNQLFLKTSPANRADIRRALAALDKPQRRLVIRVAQNRQAEDSARGGEVGGQVVLGSTRRAQAEARVWDSRSVRDASAAQMVQTLDGNPAFIQVGRSLALPMRQIVYGPGGAVVNEAVVYRDVGSGFYATPRVNGQRVTVDISQQAEQFVGGRGNVSAQRLTTTVSGQLGEWIELGGTGARASGEQGGAFSRGSSEMRDARSIWLKVDTVD